jgi:putative oxidoreductase
MIVAVHFTSGKGFFWTQGGLEYSLLILLVGLVFLVHGGGEYSLDRKLGREL